MKGFTLIEVLGVLIILGLLTLIAVPVITNILKENTNTLSNTQLSNIKQGAIEYVSENLFKYNFDRGTKCTVTIKELKQLGYLDQNIIDPKTNENFDEESKILIENNSGTIDYTVCINQTCNLTNVLPCGE